MPDTGDLRVTRRGQMSLPAAARHRWGLNDGGRLGFVDLGDVMLIVPGGADALRSSLLEAIDDQTWSAARAGFGDPELATE